MYQKNIENGYIVSLASGVSQGNISKSEYDNIIGILQNRPKAPKGKTYRLKTDLTWELVEITDIEEIPEESSIEEEITEIQMALAEIYEMLGGEM